MTVGLEHPVVAEYLRRLDAAALRLPPGRREELALEIRGHIVAALAESGRDDEATVRGVLDRLGQPDDIVRAELDDAPPPPAAFAAAQPGFWGPIEVVAVLGLTVGNVVLPVVGPVIGIVCAWVSERWTTREKIVATLWTVLVPIVLLLGIVVAGGLLVTGSPTSDSTRAPVVESIPAASP